MAWVTAQAGLSGAGGRLLLDAVTVSEFLEWGALSGTVTAGAEGVGWTYTGNLQPTFVVNSGPCTVAEGGRCVGRWPGGYMPSEDCAIGLAGAGGPLGACTVFDIENDSSDLLTLPDGSTHSDADCPAGILLAAGQTLAWHSNGDHQGGRHGGLPYSFDGAGGGWQICF